MHRSRTSDVRNRTLAAIVLAVSVSGCAPLFQRDLAKTVERAKVPVVDCEAAGARAEPAAAEAVPLAAEAVPTAAQAALFGQLNESELATLAARSETDLEIGERLILRDDARRSQPGFTAEGLDLAQFAGEVPYLDVQGIQAAHESVAAFKASRLLDRQSTSGAAFGRGQWQVLMERVGQATATSGWTADMAQSLGAAARIYAAKIAQRRDGVISFAEAASVAAREAAVREAAADATKKFILAVYFKAYFRNGRIFEVKYDTQALESQLMTKIKEKIKDPKTLDALKAEMDQTSGAFQKSLCGQKTAASCTVLGALGEQTFVTRAGKSYGFPGVSAAIDLTAGKKISTNKINAEDIAEDLVRVLVEAAGDAADPVPGVANSTLCKELKLCATDAQGAAIQIVDDIGDATEAGASAIVSQVVRGTWLFSLNNEALARSLTTGIAVGARKVAEAAAWHRAQGECRHDGNPHRDIAIELSP
jgi:hypothetical protein